MRPDEPRKRDGGVADLDALDLAGLIAERDRAHAELERIRREKREMEIELAILKGGRWSWWEKSGAQTRTT